MIFFSIGISNAIRNLILRWRIVPWRTQSWSGAENDGDIVMEPLRNQIEKGAWYVGEDSKAVAEAQSFLCGPQEFSVARACRRDKRDTPMHASRRRRVEWQTPSEPEKSTYGTTGHRNSIVVGSLVSSQYEVL